ncbi:MAG TPA: TIGR03085 family metal-binding protein, partial [Acidothermaceae bacterium]|nr:TIGR03085 family metal-binding protein [Acidothermaceae bacterium]
MTNLAASERARLSDLLDRVGPDAPTLCEGWNTRDLTAHLVLRESRPDAVLGVVIRPLSGWTARVQKKLARNDFTDLVSRLRNGPPRWSLFRPRAVDELLSNVEFFVHHEDVRRAAPHWEPRVLTDATNAFLWERSTRMAKHVLRSAPGGVELIRSDTGQHRAVRAAVPGQSTLTLTGAPQELILYMYGRRDHA